MANPITLNSKNPPTLLAYGFRPFFLLLTSYIILTTLLWGMHWAGFISLIFTDNIIEWHIYEMLFGLAAAGIAGFLLTALPEFFERVTPVTGKPLLWAIILWAAGRLSFWMIDLLGPIIVSIVNLSFWLWLLYQVIKPVLSDPQKRHSALAFSIMLLTTIQIIFFISKIDSLRLMTGITADSIAILKMAVGAFMILILSVLQRVNTGVINGQLEQLEINELFISRPPRYYLAMFTLLLFTIVEFLLPGNHILAWLAFAVSAAILNTLNDFFIKDVRLFTIPLVWPLASILMLMALGYGFMAVDYLDDSFYSINHFRHILTTGALGLAYIMIMSIVSTVHTGRILQANRWLNVTVALIIIASLLRASIAFFPQYAPMLFFSSSLIWVGAFVVYLFRFSLFLISPRADGLPG
ncbi:NnrS family protein [Alkalimarinus alittae]|uniref:NnrS family protein n=1 Tax=Alkalimarinus alittae TaxID=2961619 RepID=A0ABY6N4K8_9ALTE|nr:NnrS family protein [Alkalimarinus alittae]UZE97056.1 NnrS family protein [Alkalimarinus alittae]